MDTTTVYLAVINQDHTDLKQPKAKASPQNGGERQEYEEDNPEDGQSEHSWTMSCEFIWHSKDVTLRSE